jgi:hypothetical protein
MNDGLTNTQIQVVILYTKTIIHSLVFSNTINLNMQINYPLEKIIYYGLSALDQICQG